MTINFFNPDRSGETMECLYCHKDFKLLFACSGCNNPVCSQCGLLEQPNKSHLLSLVDNVNTQRDLNSEREIGFNEWLDSKDEQERFLCTPCQDSSVKLR